MAIASLSGLERVIEQVVTTAELADRLEQGRGLRIKYGVDLTAPFLHIGHGVNLWAMRYMQDLGHKVILLIGDFTTRVGDPTGKSETRPKLEAREIESYAANFIEQVSSILRTDPDVFEVRRNSEWYDSMPAGELLGLLSMVTHSRLIDRDMFQRRIAEEKEIYMHEVLYPVLQGYDSVMLESDLTIVGTDQLFNELMGRLFQERYRQQPQVVITTRITPGTDGKAKQSKSLGNYIALADSPRDKYGKAMSIPDQLTVPYLEVYTTIPIEDVAAIAGSLEAGKIHPMEAKRILAKALVERYHSARCADEEDDWFMRVFSVKQPPEDAPQVAVPRHTTLFAILESCLPRVSRSELRRLVKHGAVRLNDSPVRGINDELLPQEGDLLRVGRRRWFRLSIEDGV